MAAQASDKRLELAYDAAQKKLAMQDTTLGNVRTRANTLLATAALFTSFSAGIGLLNADPAKGPVFSPCASAGLLIIVVLLGGCVFYVAWPAKKWHFVPSASIIMEKIRAQETEEAIRTLVTNAMIDGGNENQPKLDRRHLAFRLAVILLVAEVALLIWLLIVR
ncbi:hypothetical protein [Mycobacterium colombiense]|uniref:hypothetical protein n=1 Tax=Mycobacterium colombiense TaxID=339268 RepID=UPI000801DBD2|nr:hypothetical protein [Mycobacterium colombiense]OBJ65816.1 hypothetical protein A5627_05720 [Mycobacterium colombiense]